MISERRLAIQFFFCCIFLVISVVVTTLIEPWHLLPQIMGFVATSCVILNSASTPFIYLYSSEVRKGIKNVFL